MSRWVVGDVQGCAATFEALFAAMGPDAQVFCVGDLVNRGPGSARVLRRLRGAGGQSVLGNHDIYLLARAAGLPPRPRDTLASVLAEPELVQWVRHRPLLLEVGDRVIVHAGLAPGWSLADARAAARRVEAALQGPGWRRVVRSLFEAPTQSPIAEDVAWLTRVRMVDATGAMVGYSGPPDGAPAGLRHWAEVSAAVQAGAQVVYGHWAAQGYRRLQGTIALDSGCVWGRQLTAWNLDDDRVVQVDCQDRITSR